MSSVVSVGDSRSGQSSAEKDVEQLFLRSEIYLGRAVESRRMGFATLRLRPVWQPGSLLVYQHPYNWLYITVLSSK